MLVLVLLTAACGQVPPAADTEVAPDYAQLELPERPNILWLVAEDMSPVIECFGDSTVQTPNLSRLAREGVRYTNFYSTHGVCAPSRAAIATGMYPASVGTNHMRTGGNPDFLPPGVVPYSAVIPPEVRMHSEQMRMAGYYCTNNSKEDYQFQAPVTAWDESSRQAHWRNGPADKPFFAIFNFTICHESGMWRNKDRPLLADPAKVVIPDYYPDTEIVRNELARMYSNIVEMDRQVGEVLTELEEDGLLEKTIIFWYSDHGGPLPRQKREIYDSGLKVPMIIRFPDQQLAGQVDDQLISFIDLKPTIMSLAGRAPPTYLHGQAFLGKHASAQPRGYVHAARDRLDSEYDRVRGVRDKCFKYIKNYHTDRPNIMNIAYRKQMTLMQELYRLDSLGQLKGPQKIFFADTKPEEELYDCLADPYEVNNLADNPDYQSHLQRLRQEHESWTEKYGDLGDLPEPELVAQMYPDMQQPHTEIVEADVSDAQIVLSCATEGASIAYQIVEGTDPGQVWQVYTAPISNPRTGTLVTLAHRIGFEPSKEVHIGLSRD